MKVYKFILNSLERRSSILLWVFVVSMSVLYGLLSIVRHMHFQSGAFDLGIFDQAVWQYSHFMYPFNTIKGGIILGDHLTLTLPLLAPLYWIWDDVRMLLAFQAVWISFSAIAIYKYLVKRGLSGLQSFLLSVIYLLFYGIQSAIFFDFHPIVIGVGILAWVLYFWEAEKWKLFAVSTFLLFLTQENLGLGLFALCLIWLFQKKRRKLVIGLAVLSLLYTAAAFYAIHLFGALQYVPQLPANAQDLVSRYFDDPQKRQVWWYSYIWYSFLPLFSPGAFLAVLSDLSQYFITGDAFNRMWSPFTHHRAILSVYLLAGAADVLIFLKSKKKVYVTPLIIIMLLVSLVSQYHYHFALDKLAKKTFWQNELWIRNDDSIISHVPQNVSVAAQQSLVPHLSHREKIFLIYPRQRKFRASKKICSTNPCWWLDSDGSPDFYVVDIHPGVWPTMTLENEQNFNLALQNMINAKVLRLYYQKDDAKIYRVDKSRWQYINT